MERIFQGQLDLFTKMVCVRIILLKSTDPLRYSAPTKKKEERLWLGGGGLIPNAVYMETSGGRGK